MDGKVATYFLVQSQKYQLKAKINIEAYFTLVVYIVCTVCEEEYLFSVLS